MKKRIEQLLNGKFIYEQPELLFSQDRIFATLKAGETTKDEIYFGTDDNRRISGFADYVQKCKKDGMEVYLLEYTKDKKLIRRIKQYCRKNKFHYYISDSIELD